MSHEALKNKIIELHDKSKTLESASEKVGALSAAIEIANEIVKILDPSTSGLKHGEDALEEIISTNSFRNTKVAEWFAFHPIYPDERLALKLFESDICEMKFYWLNDNSTKARISAGVMLTPNWEDGDTTANDNYKVGVDFFLKKDAKSLLMVVSERGNLRVMEFSERLTHTQEEILDKIAGSLAISSRKALHTVLWDSMALSEVNKKFYEGIARDFTILYQHLIKCGKNHDDAKLFASRLLGRLLFIWFLRKKGVIFNDEYYFPQDIKDSTKYYNSILKPLFFQTLNTPVYARKNSDLNTPYLNGGLFDAHNNDWQFEETSFPATYFTDLFNHLNKYNFTTDESSPDYEQVAIDPEMLGRVFESLLAEQRTDTGEQARKAKGAFYTPREIVSYMCKESLRQYLYNELGDEKYNSGVDKLLDLPDYEWEIAHSNAKRDLWPFENMTKFIPRVIGILDSLTVLDPACGSGAFPMGMLQLLTKTYERLDSRFDLYKTKMNIIQNTIFGVDIEPMAVEISRLRAWLAIIVDDKGEIDPLPNLDFKFVCADSLIPLERSVGLWSDPTLQEKMANIRKKFFNARKPETKEKRKNEYYKLTSRQPSILDKRENQLKSFDPFKNQHPSEFFDSEYMFGVNKFDIVIGNPPYVHLEKMKDVANVKYKPLNFKTYEARGDLYGLFFERFIGSLKDNGILTFITSNKWMRAGYGESLRDYFVNNTQPVLLVDLGSGVFESATVDTDILILKKKSYTEPTDAVIITQKAYRKELSDFIKQNAIKNTFKVGDSWAILSEIEHSIKAKIEKIGIPLKNWNIKISRGILTGCNEAYIIDEEKRRSILDACASEDENMNEQYDVFDDGRTEIFFPFQYDKYQLKVLGIIDNKASIIEGPPGTGKSQTIANILCHLAATGKKVLFVSQKDQAVRGVKDKLKSLDIPFLFGYIPDRTSRLYTEEDEKDSAVNTLKSFQKTFIKEAISDQKEPLRLISNEQKIFSDGVNNERNLFDYYTQRRALDYVKPYAMLGVTREWWTRYDQLWNQANQLTRLVKNYQENNLTFMKKEASALRGINVDCNVINDFLAQIINEFNEIIPERSGTLKAIFIHNKMNSALKRHGKTIIQEIYLQAENIVFSEQTKSARLKDLQELKNYFKNRAAAEKVSVLKTELLGMLAKKGMSQEQADNLRNIITQKGLEDVFSDTEEYISLTEEINNIEYFSANEINQEIKELQKYYKTNVCNYIRNRILKQIDAVNSQKSTKAILNRVANSLSKGRKAYKTFDKLKNGEDGPDNFRAMSEAIPIWMISLEDVNRIIPMVANAFDYVILDEASQCNLAYSLPVMYRARHTVFFGDSLQMRDTNTLFKSNQQLEAIAKKNKISEYYQIKATEDSVKSVMDIATLAGFKTAVLRYHYRSPKELIGFSNENFYKAVGRSLEVVNDNILTFKDTNRVLINHVIEVQDENEDSGKRNYAEVKYIKDLIKELKSNPKTKDKSIAVLTFFNEQAELLRQSIEDEDVKVSIIEGIQGDERDIIIYSFVIRDPSEKKRYIALTGEGGDIRKGAAEGRVNVAFSRARLQVHCVTSLKPELWPEGIWIKKYLEYVDKNGIPEIHNSPSEQIFDSGFEEEVFKKIAASLDNRSYSMETQVKSCGFRIDLVISNKKNAKKLAVECDGPTHFENGDGQVYVKDDWERQMVLETAGWHFYRISYFDWMEERDETLRDTLKYIHDYLDDDSNIPLSTPNSIKMLRANRIIPEEEKRNIYVTHFENSSEKTITSPATQANNTASIATQVNQSEFEQYLRRHNGSTITIRYQSTRKDSASKWRHIPMEKYDSVYIYARHEDGYFIRYRRDRVVEYK